MAISRITSQPPEAPAASDDSFLDLGKLAAYAGIFTIALGVNYVGYVLTDRQVKVIVPTQKSAENLYEEALRYMESQEDGMQPTEEDYKKAIKNLTSAFKKTPSPSELHAKILVQRGLAFMMVNAANDAVADFSFLLELYPRSESCAGVFINRAHCYEQLEKFDEALKDFATAESCTSDHQLRFTIFFNRGCLYQDRCDNERAIKDFKRALRCDPTNEMKADILHRLGFCSIEEDLYEDAIDYFSSALKCPDIEGPTHAEILYHRATVYNKIDDRARALNDLNTALKNKPSKETREDIEQLIREIRNSDPFKYVQIQT